MAPHRHFHADPLPDLSHGTECGDGRPDPYAAATAAEFVEVLRQLRSWSGVGFRRLEKRAADLGMALPRSTITAALKRNVLPREELVVALVRACGGEQNDADRYVTVRRRIAAGTSPAPPAPPARFMPPVRAVMVRARRGRNRSAAGAGSHAYEIGMSGEDKVGVPPLPHRRRGDLAGIRVPVVLLTVVPAPVRSTVMIPAIDALTAVGGAALLAGDRPPACVIIYG